MATFTATVTYPDAKQADLRDTLATRFGYQATINGQPNPQSKSQFIQALANDRLKVWLKSNYEEAKAAEVATANQSTIIIDIT